MTRRASGRAHTAGRPERKRPADALRLRRRVLLTAFALAGAAILGRAFQLQALESDRWTAAALDQQRERLPLPARRGAIYDRDGVALALSHETFRISIAPAEVRDREKLTSRLREALGIPAAEARRVTDPARKWVVLRGRFSTEQRQALGEMRGVYYERRLERFYPQGRVGRELIGVVSGDGRALGGIEQQFDEMLRGEPGHSILRRSARGEASQALSLPVVAAKDGADVHLTIDFDLQEIADGALRDAIEETGARGGDLLILDPRSGELLAAVSQRQGGATLAAITEPYEPGSTLKPFFVAALLTEGAATLADTVSGESGRWRDPNGRMITDSRVAEEMSLREALIYSSNIGIVKFTSLLQPGQQYQYLRDFGFGTPTGVAYPSESAGRLRRPRDWSAYSAASLAMGYEVSVTPLQLGAAYGALANRGVLMEPYMVDRVVDVDGSILQRNEPRALRRVVPAGVADAVTDVLVEVVEEGTATRASLASFSVAGKTGTARRTGANGRYESGAYTSTFVSYFPAQDPRIVILVKLDRPTGAYYGGLTAAPVTRETLQGILATRTSALDGGTLLATRAAVDTQLPIPGLASAFREPATQPKESSGEGHLLRVDSVAATDAEREIPGQAIVPDVSGLWFRDAAQQLHAAGLHVRLDGRGRVDRSHPAAGAAVASGDTVLLIGGRS